MTATRSRISSRAQVKSHSNLGRKHQQRLAQQILGKDNPERIAQAILGSQNRQRKAQTLFEKNRIQKTKKNKKQSERRRARGTPAQPYRRCMDWMVHSGDIHYARNSSSFYSYTRIDAKASRSLELGDVRALGIGTVFLQARKEADSDEVTGLRLHDVLHIPSMPCNGISFSRLQAANLEYETDVHGDFVAKNPSQVPMFHGMHEYGLYRLALDQDPIGESPLAVSHDEHDDLSNALSLSAKNTKKIAKLGQASRDIDDIERRDGFRPWKDGFEVEC